MNTLGIIAEYDPFHTGHARHIALAKEKSGCRNVLCVMSGSFTQRGSPAIMTPYARAEAAVRCGADAVFLLPVHFALREAENFALGGVYLLKKLGATHIAFGCETDDTDLLYRAASLLEGPDENSRKTLKNALSQGLSYPAAVSEMLEAALPGNKEQLSLPNNILAISYLRADIRLRAGLIPVPVLRKSSHHDDMLTGYPSSSAVRKRFFETGVNELIPYLPAESLKILMREQTAGRICPPGSTDKLLLHTLRLMTKEQLAEIAGISEGLENRILSYVNKAAAAEELLQSVKTKRYPYTRLNRIAANILIGITKASIPTLPEYTRLLACNQNGLGLIPADLADTELIDKPVKASSPSFFWELRADTLWHTLAGIPAANIYQQHAIIL